MRRGGALLAVLLLCGCFAAGEGGTADFPPGSAGIGDSYFPTYGNGGYDVAGYDLDLRYDPASGRLGGTATITATATQNLSRFDFDLAGLTTSRVTVDGQSAKASVDGNELVVTPAAGVLKGR